MGIDVTKVDRMGVNPYDMCDHAYVDMGHACMSVISYEEGHTE